MNPKYQIFVSSTYIDLRDERQAVLEAILELQQFPAGMEIFPASNRTSWDLIRSVISESDYYILIIGGRYGSTDGEGISYTEKEFDYAKSLGKPTLCFLHKNPGQIVFDKSEQHVIAREKLAAFRKKAEGSHCKYWESRDELKVPSCAWN